MSDRIILNQEQVSYLFDELLSKHPADKMVTDAVSILRAAMLSSHELVDQDDTEMEKIHEAFDILTDWVRSARDVSELSSVENLRFTYDQQRGHAQRMQKAETSFDRTIAEKRERKKKHLRQLIQMIDDDDDDDDDDELRQVLEKKLKRLEE
jgi:hypothetical protein